MKKRKKHGVKVFWTIPWRGRVALRVAILCAHLRLGGLARKLGTYASRTVIFSKSAAP